VRKSLNKTHSVEGASQSIRIISGCWRGTKLPVILHDDIRPTPSRVRETLFNWLQVCIEGCCCLDLFAGSGALGFEAVSRGAAQATLIDVDQRVISLLTKQVEKLKAVEISLICTDSMKYLEAQPNQFDLIFIDPPYSNLMLRVFYKNC